MSNKEIIVRITHKSPHVPHDCFDRYVKTNTETNTTINKNNTSNTSITLIIGYRSSGVCSQMHRPEVHGPSYGKGFCLAKSLFLMPPPSNTPTTKREMLCMITLITTNSGPDNHANHHQFWPCFLFHRAPPKNTAAYP